MHRFLILSLLWASVAALACSPNDSSSTEHYVDLADIRMYYEAAGSGAPLVLLHGGFGSSDVWDEYFPLLSDHTVITPDSRGQGRTSIGDGPLTYGRMAGDVLRLLDYLGIGQAHFVGHSDGGCILFHLLIDYPDRVASATLIGAPYHTDNYSPQVYAAIQKIISSLSQAETAPFEGPVSPAVVL
jgi:pimeloyl-ACP methyl ester carboxylesterase